MSQTSVTITIEYNTKYHAGHKSPEKFPDTFPAAAILLPEPFMQYSSNIKYMPFHIKTTCAEVTQS